VTGYEGYLYPVMVFFGSSSLGTVKWIYLLTKKLIESSNDDLFLGMLAGTGARELSFPVFLLFNH
jgi:hypothetical protein